MITIFILVVSLSYLFFVLCILVCSLSSAYCVCIRLMPILLFFVFCNHLMSLMSTFLHYPTLVSVFFYFLLFVWFVVFLLSFFSYCFCLMCGPTSLLLFFLHTSFFFKCTRSSRYRHVCPTRRSFAQPTSLLRTTPLSRIFSSAARRTHMVSS